MPHPQPLIHLHIFIHGMHAVAAGNVLGGFVGIADEGRHFVRSKIIKGIIHKGPSCFRGIPMMPIEPLKEVAHFKDLPTPPRLVGEAALTDKSARFFKDDGIKAKAPFSYRANWRVSQAVTSSSVKAPS